MKFSLLLPLVNFKADFLKTAKGSFMEIWRNHWENDQIIKHTALNLQTKIQYLGVGIIFSSCVALKHISFFCSQWTSTFYFGTLRRHAQIRTVPSRLCPWWLTPWRWWVWEGSMTMSPKGSPGTPQTGGGTYHTSRKCSTTRGSCVLPTLTLIRWGPGFSWNFMPAWIYKMNSLERYLKAIFNGYYPFRSVLLPTTDQFKRGAIEHLYLKTFNPSSENVGRRLLRGKTCTKWKLRPSPSQK